MFGSKSRKIKELKYQVATLESSEKYWKERFITYFKLSNELLTTNSRLRSERDNLAMEVGYSHEDSDFLRKDNEKLQANVDRLASELIDLKAKQQNRDAKGRFLRKLKANEMITVDGSGIYTVEAVPSPISTAGGIYEGFQYDSSKDVEPRVVPVSDLHVGNVVGGQMKCDPRAIPGISVPDATGNDEVFPGLENVGYKPQDE